MSFAEKNSIRYNAVTTGHAETIRRTQVIERVEEAQLPPAIQDREYRRWKRMLQETAGQIEPERRVLHNDESVKSREGEIWK